MKVRSFLASSALLFGSMNSVLVPPALADIIPTPTATGPNSTTLDAMEAQCDAKAAVHGVDWNGEVDLSSISSVLTAGPTEVEGTRVIDESSIVGTGIFTPGHTFIEGEPFRIGGSVNMFGDQFADSGSWSDSTYNYDADFVSTFTYSFNCTMTETVHVPVQGHYVVEPEDQGDEEESQKSCDAFNALGPSAPFWGEDHAQCDFVTDVAAHDEDQPRPDEAGTPIAEEQTDTLTAFEDHGGPVDAPGGLFHIGQVVICISPSKPTPGGTWRTQNGYTGVNCTTDWFTNHAVWGSGTESSNGTYISVPDYNL